MTSPADASIPRPSPAGAIVPRAPAGAAREASGARADGGDSDAPPRWELGDLYASPDAPEVARDFADAERRARAFEAGYGGRLATLDGAALATAIGEYEAICELLARLGSYAGLRFAIDGLDPERGRFLQSVTERTTEIGARLLFFPLALNGLDASAVEALAGACPALARFRPFLSDLAVFRPYQLAPEIERVLHEKEVTGAASWSRLFDETMAGLSVPVDGEELTLGEALNRLSSSSRPARAAAAGAIAEVLGRNARLLSLILNTLVKDKRLSDGWRGHASPGAARNRQNMVEDEVVGALVDAVTESYPRTSHRYYAMKARWLGLDRLQYWDRNAPVPGDDDRSVPWDEARARVLGAYDRFDPAIGAIGRTFFDRNWIDAAPARGKAAGAFAHPTVPSAHPFLLLNYRGRARDVMTLAHELGHGIHQVLAAGQGHLMSQTPLTLAETASVFGETLCFRALLDAETDPGRRRAMLAAKVEDMLNTVARQISFHRFETALHDARARAELTADEIGAIWLETQREALGPAFEFAPGFERYWSYVPHFVHSPFYVYAYAFGDCLVNALYATFEAGHPGFAEKYRALLASGGSRRHRELLAPFGLDASDPAFWRRGLAVLEGYIDELERGQDHG